MTNLVGSYHEWKPFSIDFTFVKEAVNTVNIVSTEAYATLRYVVPASITWVWRKYITNEIKTIPIEITVDKVKKVAYLNIHGNFSQIKNSQDVYSVLLGHGDYGHPYTILHLADIAQKEGRSTFSLYIPGIENNKDFSLHGQFIKQAIDKIESFVKDGCGCFNGVLGVGHSKFAIIFAQRQYVVIDSRIKGMCSVAGRLNIPNEEDRSDLLLKTIIRAIYQGILRNPESPIMQIIPKDDWNAAYEAMAVRPHEYCYTVPGMHLSGLYKKETRIYFTDFLNTFSSQQVV